MNSYIIIIIIIIIIIWSQPSARWRMSDVRCAVVHVKLGVHTHDASGPRREQNAHVHNLEESNRYKFLDILETVRQEERLSMGCVAKEYLRRMSIIWSSPLSDHNRVTASNQFA